MIVEGKVVEPGTGKVAWASDGAHLVGNGASMEQLVFTLSGRMRGPVTDRTGLTGRFDYNVVFARDDKPSDVNGPPELSSAIQDGLGLRLEKNKTTVGVLVIDHVEKPTEN
jgi:uncharacterized protein (TIGR03435 family)